MPLYFFDVDEDERQVRDETGMELDGEDLARKEGSTLLQTLSDLRRVEGRAGNTYVRVRDSGGVEVFTGSAHLRD
jgi:hypothetical protein